MSKERSQDHAKNNSVGHGPGRRLSGNPHCDQSVRTRGPIAQHRSSERPATCQALQRWRFVRLRQGSRHDGPPDQPRRAQLGQARAQLPPGV